MNHDTVVLGGLREHAIFTPTEGTPITRENPSTPKIDQHAARACRHIGTSPNNIYTEYSSTWEVESLGIPSVT